MKFFESRLDNGLKVIGEQNKSALSTAIGFFVSTGARDEVPEVAGVSHFLEHMMFKGTDTRSALDITYQLGSIGAQANAYTSEENTVYFLAVLPEYFEKAFELLSDMLRPALDRKEFDLEKNVILEEIALYQDRPTHCLFERSMEAYFGSHPAGNSVLGTIDSVKGISRDSMKEYFDSRYTASSITLVASGCFEWDLLLELASRYCSHWPGQTVERQRPPFTAVPNEKTLRKADLNKAYMCMMGPGPEAKDEARYSADVLSCILGDSTGSRSFWALVDKGIADSASIDIEDMDGVGLVYGFLSCAPENIDEAAGIFEKVMADNTSFSEEELRRAVTKIATRFVLSGESPLRRLLAIGSNWLCREDYRSLEEELLRIKAVSRESIENLLKRYDFNPLTKVTLLPE